MHSLFNTAHSAGRLTKLRIGTVLLAEYILDIQGKINKLEPRKGGSLWIWFIYSFNFINIKFSLGCSNKLCSQTVVVGSDVLTVMFAFSVVLSEDAKITDPSLPQSISGILLYPNILLTVS